jgi:hypothetical protein
MTQCTKLNEQLSKASTESSRAADIVSGRVMRGAIQEVSEIATWVV